MLLSDMSTLNSGLQSVSCFLKKRIIYDLISQNHQTLPLAARDSYSYQILIISIYSIFLSQCEKLC